jgi:acetylornithine deacetylase/succinyl-diaminopimelate desuccinylase-like protein
VKLPRIVLLLESEEESGSPNLLSLLEEAKDILGKLDYVLCMDTGPLNYE